MEDPLEKNTFLERRISFKAGFNAIAAMHALAAQLALDVQTRNKTWLELRSDQDPSCFNRIKQGFYTTSLRAHHELF